MEGCRFAAASVVGDEPERQNSQLGNNRMDGMSYAGNQKQKKNQTPE